VRGKPAPKSRDEPLSKQRLRLWLRMLKVSRLVSGALRDKLRKEHGTTLPRFDVMAALYRAEDGLKMSALSGVLRVSNGNVTGLVDRLEAEGLLERVAVAGDRRATIVRLTRKGRDEFAGLAALHEGWLDSLLCALGRAETEELSRLLGRVGDSLDGRRTAS
jgi:DNA-binding MarR family transcriptional regulator